ncbi:MAG: hypothetical protein ABIE22_01575 [archaeon]
MVLTLTIPEPGKQKRIKDIIIDVLSFEWPLSLSQIHNRVKKNYNHTGTCQATYKAINELLLGEVLLKQNKQYSIDLKWIDKLKEFSEHVATNYNSGEKVPLIEGVVKAKTENNVTVLTFNSLVEMDKMWIKIKKDYYQNLTKKRDVTFWQGSHCWWLLVYPEMEFNELSMLKEKKVKHFFINHNNKPLDQYAKRFYENYGINFKTKKEPIDCDIGVFGDTIMQVYLPKDAQEKIEEIYNKHSSPNEVNLPEFIDKVLNKKRQINLILTRNKEIANQLKEKALKEFNQQV